VLGRRCRLVRALALVSPLSVVEIQGREVELFERFEFHRRVLRVGVQLRPLAEHHCKLVRHPDYGEIIQFGFSGRVVEVFTRRQKYVAEKHAVVPALKCDCT
jgi:hypothetical protein